MLDIKVQTFLCVCKYMNYTKAGEELHITQSAVSQQIKGLESFYGTKLFEYKKPHLYLTEAGKSLRSSMEAMYNDTERIKAFLGDNEKMPTLKIGTTMSVGDFFLPDFFARFLHENPKTNISVTRLDTKEILRLLNSGELDFAFVEGYVNKGLYAVKSIQNEPIIATCSKDFPLNTIKSLKDLFEYPLLMREEGSGTREVFEQYLMENGYSLDNFKRCSVFNSPLIIKKLLLQNCGISVMYKTVAKDMLESGELIQIKIPSFSLSHDFTAVWRKESLYKEYYERVIDEMVRR